MNKNIIVRSFLCSFVLSVYFANLAEAKSKLKKNRTTAWIVEKPGAKLSNKHLNLPQLQEDEVAVEIVACGICSSDIDAINGAYGNLFKFSIVPGHEGTDIVKDVGRLARNNFKIGERVGVGVFNSAYGICNKCYSGKNNLCAKKVFTISSMGCFAKRIHIKSTLAFKIPANIPSKYAAPLMCAGITSYAPFEKYNLGRGDREYIQK